MEHQCKELLAQCLQTTQQCLKVVPSKQPIYEVIQDLPLYILAFILISYIFIYLVYSKMRVIKYNASTTHSLHLGEDRKHEYNSNIKVGEK